MLTIFRFLTIFGGVPADRSAVAHSGAPTAAFRKNFSETSSRTRRAGGRACSHSVPGELIVCTDTDQEPSENKIQPTVDGTYYACLVFMPHLGEGNFEAVITVATELKQSMESVK